MLMQYLFSLYVKIGFYISFATMQGKEETIMTLEEKLELWVKITGVDPNQASYSIRFNGGLSSWDIKKMNDRITEALKYDAYGYFADAYLSVYFKKYLEKKQVSLQELLQNKQMQQYMDDVKLLYQEIQNSDSGKKIMDSANKAMDFYGLHHSSLEIFDIVELQVSAKRCMNYKPELFTVAQ